MALLPCHGGIRWCHLCPSGCDYTNKFELVIFVSSIPRSKYLSDPLGAWYVNKPSIIKFDINESTYSNSQCRLLHVNIGVLHVVDDVREFFDRTVVQTNFVQYFLESMGEREL